MVTVRLFAAAAEAAGTRQIAGDWAGRSVAEVLAELSATHPGLARLTPSLAVAVNRDYVGPDYILADGDEVALIPPVSGGEESAPPQGSPAATGSPLFEIVAEPISPEAVAAKVADPTIGAVVTFIGTVREWTRGRQTIYLEYEAYPEMAVAQMERIAREIQEKWPGTRVAITHRVGRLQIGEASVVIAVGAPHRAEAFAACRHAIERLKQIVPIWKKEVWADGEEWVGSQAGPDWMHPELQSGSE